MERINIRVGHDSLFDPFSRGNASMHLFIAQNEYNLNVPRYVDSLEPEGEINVAELQKAGCRIENELSEVRNRVKILEGARN